MNILIGEIPNPIALIITNIWTCRFIRENPNPIAVLVVRGELVDDRESIANHVFSFQDIICDLLLQRSSYRHLIKLVGTSVITCNGGAHPCLYVTPLECLTVGVATGQFLDRGSRIPNFIKAIANVLITILDYCGFIMSETLEFGQRFEGVIWLVGLLEGNINGGLGENKRACFDHGGIRREIRVAIFRVCGGTTILFYESFVGF